MEKNTVKNLPMGKVYATQRKRFHGAKMRCVVVLTKEELISSLQTEVRILVHLAGKVDKSKLDCRPTPRQRNTLELLQYMAIMGPREAW
ncbi:MAG TPA: hypothetical protein VJW94_12280 [Candidatus Acidoferrum sp.]|nr:hypothetical protein [Candidatus Acidoferrum sp.]